MSVDALVLRLNQVRDNEGLPEARRLEAEHIAAELQQGLVSEDVFIAEANRFLGVTQADAGRALNRSFAVRIHEARQTFSSNFTPPQERLLDKLAAAAPFCGNPDARGKIITGLEPFVGDVCREFNARGA